MKKLAYALVLTLAAGLMLSSCGNSEANNSADSEVAGQAQKAVNVKVAVAVARDLTEHITITGETAPAKDVKYSSEANGSLDLLLELGSKVKAGDVLAKVDYDTLKAQAEQARATYSLARKTYERYSSLRDDNLVSQQAIDEAYSQMVQARAQKTIAETYLKNSRVTAKFPGIVTDRYAEVGEFVGPGSPLLRVIDLSSILVEAQVPERQVSKIKHDSPVTAYISALDEEFEGEIDVLAPASDPKSKTYLLKVRVDNPDRRILSGMAVRIKIESGTQKGVLAIPQEAVLEENGGKAVFVEIDGKAEKRIVKVEPAPGQEVIVASGIEPGDRIIVVGHRGLVDGQPVNVVSK